VETQAKKGHPYQHSSSQHIKSLQSTDDNDNDNGNKDDKNIALTDDATTTCTHYYLIYSQQHTGTNAVCQVTNHLEDQSSTFQKKNALRLWIRMKFEVSESSQKLMTYLL
jgi:hypothetical protein